MSNPGVIAAIIAGVLVVLYFLFRKREPHVVAVESPEIPSYDYENAISQYNASRADLESLFTERASNSGRPRGLKWVSCEFESATMYARELTTGALSALTSVTIRFSAIEGGDMEDVEAVGNLRAATALMRFDERGWTADGRVIFNHEPADVIERFADELVVYKSDSEPVEESDLGDDQ